MNKLITLTGEYGCGKIRLLTLLNQEPYKDIEVVNVSYTGTTMPGEENGVGIKGEVPEEAIKKMDYFYAGDNGELYGFNKEEIDRVLEQGKSPIIIIDDEEVLFRLCEEYKDRICPIYMEKNPTDYDFYQELQKSGATKEQIQERLDSRKKFRDLWTRNARLFWFNYIINAPNLSKETLLTWFQGIAKENEIDIEEHYSNNFSVANCKASWPKRLQMYNDNKYEGPIIHSNDDPDLYK